MSGSGIQERSCTPPHTSRTVTLLLLSSGVALPAVVTLGVAVTSNEYLVVIVPPRLKEKSSMGVTSFPS